jgi:hypothetical protein
MGTMAVATKNNMTIQAEMGGAAKDLGKCTPAFSSRAKMNAIDNKEP